MTKTDSEQSLSLVSPWAESRDFRCFLLCPVKTRTATFLCFFFSLLPTITNAPGGSSLCERLSWEPCMVSSDECAREWANSDARYKAFGAFGRQQKCHTNIVHLAFNQLIDMRSSFIPLCSAIACSIRPFVLVTVTVFLNNKKGYEVIYFNSYWPCSHNVSWLATCYSLCFPFLWHCQWQRQ